MTCRIILPALSIALAACAWSAHGQQADAPKTAVKVGDTAPDFSLIDQDRKPVKLSDFRGKQNVVLAFYSLAFTPG
jgi:peroxiredoxin